MVGISKMTSVFLYKPPNPLGGGEDPQLKYYVIFYKGGNFKMKSNLGAPDGGGLGGKKSPN